MTASMDAASDAGTLLQSEHPRGAAGLVRRHDTPESSDAGRDDHEPAPPPPPPPPRVVVVVVVVARGSEPLGGRERRHRAVPTAAPVDRW